MADEFKLDINFSQKSIEDMAKQVIKEIIENNIQEAMNKINLEYIIKERINSIDSKLSKKVNDTVNKLVSELNIRCMALLRVILVKKFVKLFLMKFKRNLLMATYI